MARQQVGLAEDVEARFLLVVEPGEIVIADRAGRHLLRKNQIEELLAIVGKDIAHLGCWNLRVHRRHLLELEAVSLEEKLRQKITRRRLGIFEGDDFTAQRSEEHTSELQSRQYLVCRLLLEKKKKNKHN